jgi:hypothetical protein
VRAHPAAALRPAAALTPACAAGLRHAAAASSALAARRAAVALPPLVARPGAPAAPRGGAVACEALGLGTIGALCGKLLKLLGISGGGGAVKAAAASAASAAGSAGKAALMTAAAVGLLKYMWWAAVGILVVGVAMGAVLSYLGVPQVAIEQVNTLMGKPGLKLYTNPASRGTIVNW